MQTSLVSRALDGYSDPDKRFEIIADLLKYLHTDTVLYVSSCLALQLSACCSPTARFSFHEEHPERLVKLQESHWNPLIDWANQTYGLSLQPYVELFGTKQPVEVTDKLAAVVAKYSGFQLAAFEKAVHTSKSFLISLALVEGRLTVEEAAQAAHVEVQSQIDRWGEVEDCESS